MKKQLLVIASLFSFSALFAQVGVNNTSPLSTLDIAAKTATGSSVTTNEGLLIPRVDRARALSMASPATSTLIYVNDISTGTQTGTAINIDAMGFYYYNGLTWTKLGGGSGLNIYNGNGSLSGNRTVTQASNTLAFTGNATNMFSVDGSTFSVDAANNRIGMGTNAPASTLDITATAATGTSTAVDGLLVPRVDRQRAGSMASVPLSTMIYVNSVSTGAATGTTANMDTVGFYYFDGSLWQKMVQTSSSATAPQYQNARGTVTTVTTNSYTVQPTDFFIYTAATSGGVSITLPTPIAADAGRMLIVFNGNPSNQINSFFGVSSSSPTPNPNPQRAGTLICTGSAWVTSSQQ